MTKKTWIIFAVVCVALIGGLIYISRGKKIDVSNVDVNKVQAASSQNGNIGDHTYGNMNSKVILIEYGDYQCPGCGSAYPVIKQVTQKYKDQVGFIFRNFPLYTLHPNAFAAASAAEAAGLQGKFWQMHDALYENQDAWESLTGADRTQYFASLARQVGADSDKLVSQLNDSNVKQKIDFDHALGQKIGITGTPSIFLNGKAYGDVRYNGDKLGTTSTDDAYVWSDAGAFERLVLVPALQANGIALPKDN